MNAILNVPYPSIENATNSKEFGYQLFNAYAGVVSEFSASSVYSYQSFILPKDTSKILEQIGMVEMRHLEILAELILKSGLIPYYISYNNKYPIPWNADYINYTTDYKQMLEDNIKNEQIAITEYKRLIISTNDIPTKNMLKRIIMDEEHHIEIFKDLQKKNYLI